MKNKLPIYLYKSWILSLTLLFAASIPISAQTNSRSARINSTPSGVETHQFPAAYYNSSWTNYSERIDATGEVSGSAINPRSFTIPNTSTSSAPEATHATVVYDNGPHFNVAGTPDLSVLESVTLGMNSLGGNVSNSAGFAIADDFELVSETEITGVTAYAYQTGAASTTINGMYVTIWDGDPSNGASSIVWGDQTTNVFNSVEDISAYRVSETDQGARNRMIQKVNGNVTGLTLTAGTYWLQYSLTGTSSSGPWQPPIAILGEDTTGDALQLVSTGWQPWLDTGTNTPQGVPFQIHGEAIGGAGCEWTVIVQDTSWGDEVEWELREAGGAILLSGGGYGNGYYDEQTVTAEGPLEFYITSDGFFGDNEPSYSVATDGTEILSGVLDGGDTLTFSGLNCDAGSSGIPCSQGTASNGIENGWGNISLLIYANDFVVAEDDEFTLEEMRVNFLLNPGVDIISADIFFYEDTGGNGPGTEIPGTSSLGAVPDSQDVIGNHPAGFDLIEGVWTLDTPITFEGAVGGAVYWMGMQIEYAGANAFIETSSVYNTPNESYFSDDDGATWVSGLVNFGDDMHGVITFSGQCEIEGGVTFPEPYCGISFSTVEPITNVEVAGIANRSSAVVGGSPALEDFTAVEGTMEQGSTHTITLEGNTNGSWNARFVVFIDWNQNGILDDAGEIYVIDEMLSNSTGEDGISVSGDIVVPADAVLGETRMRVKKTFGTNLPNQDPCVAGTSWGQAEDYTIVVEEDGGSSGNDCSLATTGVFENGKSFNKTLDRIVAQDMVVPADQNMMLEKINLNAFIGGVGAGVNAANTDIYVYEDDGGIPGALVTMIADVVPTSQTIIGEAFGYQAWDVELDFAAVELAGQEGAATTYWIGVSLEATDASNSFWEFYSDATAPVVGHGLAYDDGIAGFIIEAENEGVYTFHATCSDMGGQTSGSITTIYDGGNNGSPGGAVYFDVNVGPEDIELTALDLNIAPGGGSFTVEVYTLEGTYVGNETNQAAWTLRTEGSGTSAGEGNPSNAPLDETFVLSANTTYGMALVMASAHSHYYTNGNGSNEHFENDDLSLDLGAATNVPFTPSVFAPRIFNGTLYYNIGGGSSGEDCGQGDDSNGFENGYNITAGGSFRNADDFFVSADNTLNVRSIELNILSNDPVDSININFFNDNAGAPGATVVESVAGLVPYAQAAIGSAFGYTVYSVFVEVDLEFEGGAAGTSYWMQPEAVTTTAFWEVTSVGTLGALIHTSESSGPWTPDVDGVHHAVFKLHCDVATAPDPLCLFDITASVEPITRVLMAGIDNTSSAVVGGSPALEDFTSVEGQMSQGEDYEVAFEGNTDGNWTNYFTVWIDWDQNGEWEADEMYEIGSIVNSTGTDGQQATGTISVPSDAVLGATTMRVIKSFGSSPTNPCGQYSFGQGEDYTIIVDDLVGIEDQSMTAFTYYPNPTSGVVNITANKDISSVAVYNLLGQQVLALDRLENGQVDVTALATGSYMFRVMFEDGSMEVFKVLKE